MTKTQKQLTLAIYTANSWSSDQPSGINLLSLGTTRKIHSEAHRQGCIQQIQSEIIWNQGCKPDGPDDTNQPEKDIPALEALLKLVQNAIVGKEWLTDQENMRFNEYLYQTHQL